MAPPTSNHLHNNHPNQYKAHDKHSEEKDKRKLAIINSNPDPKNIPQIVKCHVDLGSTSFHAGCNGQHHRHSGIPRGPSHSNKPSSTRGDLIPYSQPNHDLKKTNKAVALPSFSPGPEPLKKQQNDPSSSGLIKRKPNLVNHIPSKIPQQAKSVINNNEQQCTNLVDSVVDCSNLPHVQFITDNINSFDRQQSCKSMQCCTIPSQEKVVKENSTIGQQCTKSIICCSDLSKCKLDDSNGRINCLKDKILGRIFGYLNYSDVVQCRAVQKRWDELIATSESFLEKTVFVVNINKLYNVQMDTLSYNNDPLTFARLPFRHARFQYFDHHYFKDPQAFTFRNSDNQRYFPKTSFLKNLKSLEFRSSYILWETLKRILANTEKLESLSISNCHVSETSISTYSITEFEEFNVGKFVTQMKGLEINEMKDLNNITKLVKKFVGYYGTNINTLKITYYPPAGTSDAFDDHSKLECIDFCRDLKTLIILNAKTLRTLILHVHHGPTLDLLGGHLSKELEALGQSEMDLEEFQFTPALGCWNHHPDKAPESNVPMTMKTVKNTQKMVKAVTKAFTKFLESQTNLKRLGLPCIEYPEGFTGDFASVLSRLPCSENLEDLIVPCTGFLPGNFLHRFPKLKKVKLGGSCCGNISPCWDIFKGYISVKESESFTITASKSSEWKLPIINTNIKITSEFPPSLTKVVESKASQENLDRMKNIKELFVSSLENPRHFSSLAQCLPNLTTLEVKSDFNGPVMMDNDLQACIQHLTRLRNLVIDHCENFTDFGITGIPNKYCQLMFKHQRYHLEGVNRKIWDLETATGRPLSDLKGLRKLILTGKSQLTDIGIGYGLEFQELVYCHLPYSHYITSWGIARFGKMNPSVETIILSGVNEDTKDAFKTLKRTHQRLKKGDVSRSKYYKEHESQFQDDFTLLLPTPKQVFEDLVSFLSSKISAILFSFGGPKSNAIEVNTQ